MPQDDLEKEMIAFARTLKKRAADEKTPMEEATNAFKALTVFYAAMKKYNIDTEDNGTGTFEDLQNACHAVVEEENLANGTPAIRSRSRRNGAETPAVG